MSRTVTLHFDFVSPYSWLALEDLPAFVTRHSVVLELRPVVYAALLDATGLVGPVETPAKRTYTFADVRRCAELRGLMLQGPPAHPFRSLAALRLACAHADHERSLALCVRLARAAWAEGGDLENPALLRRIARDVGMPPLDLDALLQDGAVKARLRRNTDEALARGVFGVPTLDLQGELFWGHDRLDHLAARLENRLSDPRPGLEQLLDRPRGATRKGAPRRAD